MTPDELDEYLEDLKKEKPGRDDNPMLSDFIFNRNAPSGQRFSMDGQPEKPRSKRLGQRCDGCGHFHVLDEISFEDGIWLCNKCKEGLNGITEKS